MLLKVKKPYYRSNPKLLQGPIYLFQLKDLLQIQIKAKFQTLSNIKNIKVKNPILSLLYINIT